MPDEAENLFTLGFGDWSADGGVDYYIKSNNGDMKEVISTVIQIILHFYKKNPAARVIFYGSTDDRTTFYAQLLKRYYTDFSEIFYIYSVINESGRIIVTDYLPELKHKAFIIKKR